MTADDWTLADKWHVRIFEPRPDIGDQFMHEPSLYWPQVSEHTHDDPWHYANWWKWDQLAEGSTMVAERWTDVPIGVMPSDGELRELRGWKRERHVRTWTGTEWVET